jgi:hypothetical protein
VWNVRPPVFQRAPSHSQATCIIPMLRAERWARGARLEATLRGVVHDSGGARVDMSSLAVKHCARCVCAGMLGQRQVWKGRSRVAVGWRKGTGRVAWGTGGVLVGYWWGTSGVVVGYEWDTGRVPLGYL